jgi:hypothetical protein
VYPYFLQNIGTEGTFKVKRMINNTLHSSQTKKRRYCHVTEGTDYKLNSDNNSILKAVQGTEVTVKYLNTMLNYNTLSITVLSVTEKTSFSVTPFSGMNFATR